MASAVVWIALPILLQGVQATFPPVNNPPPIPGSAVRALDISGQRVYVQDDVQIGMPPPPMVKEEAYYPTDPKVDEQRWYIAENQSGETGDFPSSAEAFDRYYSNGLPAVGPVATPLPDDNYIPQASGTSKVIPEAPASGSSDIWVLTKGPNDQLVPERWVQVQLPVTDDRVVEVVNQDPKGVAEISAFPQPSVAVKSSGPPAAPLNVQQVWVKAPPQPPQLIQNQKVIQNPPTIVEDAPVKQYVDANPPVVKQYVDANPPVVKQYVDANPPVVKQYVDANPPVVKQYVDANPPVVKQYVDANPPVVKQYTQPQIIKEAQPLPPLPPPPAPVVSKKSFVVPPPPPPQLTFKSIDAPSPKQQTFIVNQPVISEKSGGISVGKSGVPQVKHIWIPTSPQTGKFITVPAGSVVDGKSIQSKGVPLDASPPVVSETWVLRQDGPVPRFEQQKSIAAPVGAVVAETPVIQFDSPKNPPLIGKSIDAPFPADIWPARRDLPNPQYVGKAGLFQPVLPPQSILKSDGVVVTKSIAQPPPPPVIQQKTYVSKVQPLPPPRPAIVAPVPQIVKGGKQPCPIPPPRTIITPKGVPLPAYRTVATINRQPFARIIRINRYPYGSYYVLNPRIGPSLYNYPRPVVQQVKNGAVRLVAARPLSVPYPVRQVALQRKAVLPVQQIKSASPVAQPQIIYPPLQAVNRLRYAYPWGGYLRSLPVAGKNVYALPPNNKPAKIKAAKAKKSSSSSESSSSESSSSESKSAESKPKEVKKEIESESIESEASEPEPETEPVEEQSTSESAPEEVESEAVPAESETQESIEAAESQVNPHTLNAPNGLMKDLLSGSPDPFMYGMEPKDLNDPKSRVVGMYKYRDIDGSFSNFHYITDSEGHRSEIVSDEPSQKNSETNFIAATESTTYQMKDSDVSESSTFDILRD